MEAQSWPRRPTWRSKSDLGGQVGGPKLTQEANLETKTPKDPPGPQLGGRKAPQEADFEGKRRPRMRTWSEHGAKRRPKGSPEVPKMKPKS